MGSEVNSRLGLPFYSRPARVVAADLLGKLLVRQLDGKRLSGMIVEAEAYCDSQQPDLACQGDKAKGRLPTDRTRVMFGPPGHAYVYLTYGMHWMLNIVTGAEGMANAVLIRAIEPVDGVTIMTMNRSPIRGVNLTNGPAKLTQALGISRSDNGSNLVADGGVLWCEPGPETSPELIRTGPRIGLGATPEPWLSAPWRFWLDGNRFVSR